MSEPVLSLQLYSVRDALAADLDATIARVAALGFPAVEVYDFVRRAPELAASLAHHGVVAPTGHAPLIGATPGGDAPPTHDEIFDAAAALGVGLVIDPMVGPERWADIGEVRRTADQLNAAAAEARTRGLSVGYHNHSQEFHHDFDGVSAYEYFVSQLDPDVAIELDAYWAAVGRQDVVALAARLGDRLKAVHVKDGSTDRDPFLDGDFTSLDQVPAGTGAVPLAAVLDAATALEFAIVEFDDFDGDVFEGIRAGVAYLAARGIR